MEPHDILPTTLRSTVTLGTINQTNKPNDLSFNASWTYWHRNRIFLPGITVMHNKLFSDCFILRLGCSESTHRLAPENFPKSLAGCWGPCILDENENDLFKHSTSQKILSVVQKIGSPSESLEGSPNQCGDILHAIPLPDGYSRDRSLSAHHFKPCKNPLPQDFCLFLEFLHSCGHP